MLTKAAYSVAVLAALLTAAACGETTSTGTSVLNPATASPTTITTATIAVATNSKLGQILVDGSGRTVYLFLADTGSSSTCYTDCALAWPPVLTAGTPVAGTGANASLLGTTARTDGTTEVTYAGHPLYYVVSDKNAGDTTGQAVNNFGALWYVLGPDGKQITSS